MRVACPLSERVGGFGEAAEAAPRAMELAAEAYGAPADGPFGAVELLISGAKEGEADGESGMGVDDTPGSGMGAIDDRGCGRTSHVTLTSNVRASPAIESARRGIGCPVRRGVSTDTLLTSMAAFGGAPGASSWSSAGGVGAPSMSRTRFARASSDEPTVLLR